MPLDGDPLPPEQVALLKKWIEEGAVVRRAAIPKPRSPRTFRRRRIRPLPKPIAARCRSPRSPSAPTARSFCVGGYHEITVWNPADGKLIRRIGNVGQRTYAIRYSPDGQLLAVACGAPGRLGEVRIFKPDTGELRQSARHDERRRVRLRLQPARATASPPPRPMASIRVFDAADRRRAAHDHQPQRLGLRRSPGAPTARKLASASRDKTAKVFDAKTGELAITYSSTTSRCGA